MIYSLLIIFAIVLIFGQIKKAEIQMAPIIGVMFGVLYSFSETEDGKEHWLQCCVFFISITVIWISPPSGLN